jgi:hypothetical protein
MAMTAEEIAETDPRSIWEAKNDRNADDWELAMIDQLALFLV